MLNFNGGDIIINFIPNNFEKILPTTYSDELIISSGIESTECIETMTSQRLRPDVLQRPNVINILTRTGRRRNYFERLQRSIFSQPYPLTRHIKSIDYPNCDYLSQSRDVIYVEQRKELGEAFYNLYLNELGNRVTKGWVIILDDDSKLIDPNFITLLAKECEKADTTDVLLYQTYIYPYKQIIPSDNSFKKQQVLYGDVDMACFCFHHSLFKTFSFDARKGGDFNFLDKISKDPRFSFKFVTLPIGIWANYDGEKDGSSDII